MPLSHRLSWSLLTLLAACGNPIDAAPAEPSRIPVAEAPSGPHTVIVYATASLRAPFEQLARRYEQDHPGAKVELHFDGGKALLDQAYAGVAMDVVAIGDSSLMSRFAGGALLADHSPAELARNRIAIAVAKDNPKNVKTLRDLVRPDVRVALGARTASIGRHGRWALSKQYLEVAPKVEGPTAIALLEQVQAGAVDAAIVYTTTVRGVDNVTVVPVPEDENTPVLYSISATRNAAEPRGAAAFRALALSATGQAILKDCGFLPIGAK
jgi:molybdate transport system substrate-binding protein